MAWAEAPGEMAMLPGMIEVEVGVASARVVSDPPAVRVHVGRIRMSFAVTE